MSRRAGKAAGEGCPWDLSVLQLVAEGVSQARVVSRLQGRYPEITEGRVRTSLDRTRRTLKAVNTIHAVHLAHRKGILK